MCTHSIYRSILTYKYVIRKYKKKGYKMTKRLCIAYYRSYAELILECATLKETAILSKILNELLFVNIEKIDDFEQKSEEIFEKYNEKYKNSKILKGIKKVLIGITPNIRKSIEHNLNGAKGASYGKLGGAPKGNKNAQKKQPQNNPYIDIEQEREYKNDKEIYNEKDIDNEYDKEMTDNFKSMGWSEKYKTYAYNLNEFFSSRYSNFCNEFVEIFNTYFVADKKESVITVMYELNNEITNNIKRGKIPEPTTEEHRFNILIKYFNQKVKTNANKMRFVDDMQKKYDIMLVENGYTNLYKTI